MKRFLSIVSCLFLCALSTYGQQPFFFSQYVYDATTLNPAYAGSQEALSLTAQYRLQWQGVEGAPGFQSFSAHTPVASHKLGLGLRLTNDQIGGYSQQTISPIFAYRIRLSAHRFIAAGLQAGLIRQKAVYDKLHLRDPDDPAFSSQPTVYTASFGSGIFYGSKRFYAGFSVPDLFPDLGSALQHQSYRYAIRTYIAHAGWVLDVHPEIKIKPNFLLAVPEQGSVYADVNALLLLREVLWLGASYRLQQGVALLTQLQLNPQLAIGYSYDLPLKSAVHYGAPSHELSVQYRFYFVKTGVPSPRYF